MPWRRFAFQAFSISLPRLLFARGSGGGRVAVVWTITATGAGAAQPTTSARPCRMPASGTRTQRMPGKQRRGLSRPRGHALPPLESILDLAFAPFRGVIGDRMSPWSRSVPAAWFCG